MAQIAKLEFQTEVRSSANKFYDIYRRKGYLLPKICPDKIKDIQVIKGDWETVGSIKLWTYFAGNSESAKEIVEAIDDEKKSITFRALDGEILKYYKTSKSTVEVTPKGDGSIVKWIIEYEKQNDNIPEPTRYLDFISSMTKDVDAFLLKQ